MSNHNPYQEYEELLKVMDSADVEAILGAVKRASISGAKIYDIMLALENIKDEPELRTNILF